LKVILKAVIEGEIYQIKIPEAVMRDGGDFFARMNADMDRGWQMGREWVERPDLEQRCQIAADRLADAISTENDTLASLMAGYILTQRPGTRELHIATDGDPMETELL